MIPYASNLTEYNLNIVPAVPVLGEQEVLAPCIKQLPQF